MTETTKEQTKAALTDRGVNHPPPKEGNDRKPKTMPVETGAKLPTLDTTTPKAKGGDDSPALPHTPSQLTYLGSASSLSEDNSEVTGKFEPSPFTTPEPSRVSSGNSNERSAERKPTPPSKTPPKDLASQSERYQNPSKHQMVAVDYESRLFTEDNLYRLGLHEDSSKEDTLAVVKMLVPFRVPLNIEMTCVVESNTGEGQGFLVKAPTGEIFFASVKHNFCKLINEQNELEECENVTINVPGTKKVLAYFKSSKMRDLINWDATSLTAKDEDAFYFDSPGSDPAAAWKYGYEVVAAPLTSERMLKAHFEQGRFRAFDLVSPNFEIVEGTPVGILACSPSASLAQGIRKTLRKGDYEPQKFDTFIMIGQIDYVGERHVEYSVNTVSGFSGGPVFLLTNDENHMKVLATHAGYCEPLGKNFGFLIAHELETQHAS